MQPASKEIQTLSTKFKFSSNDIRIPVPIGGVIRANRDTAIWISVTAIMGMEVARLMVLQDSFMVMDMYNKRYIKDHIDNLSELVKIQIDFETFQSIVLGELPKHQLDSFEFDETSRISLRKSQDLSTKVEQDSAGHVVFFELFQASLNRGFSVAYGDFEEVDSTVVSKIHNIKTWQQDEIVTLDIDFHRIRVNTPVKMPFDIPSSYDKMNLSEFQLK